MVVRIVLIVILLSLIIWGLINVFRHKESRKPALIVLALLAVSTFIFIAYYNWENYL
jgi:hypothetical protein